MRDEREESCQRHGYVMPPIGDRCEVALAHYYKISSVTTL